MRSLLICLAALWIGVPPAAAQWTYREGPGEAVAAVWGPGGTELRLRCTAREADRELLLLGLTVIPRTTQPDDEETARFEIGRWTFTIETNPDGGLVNGRQNYLSRLEFFHPVNVNMRRQIAGGSRVTFFDTFDFAGVQFGLRGSGDAVRRLESACQRLWRSVMPAPLPAPPVATAPPLAAAPLPQPLPAPGGAAVPPEAVAALQGYVRSLFQGACRADSPLVLPPAMFGQSGGRVIVDTRQASCVWSRGLNPHCSAAGCAQWVYEYRGGQFDLVETRLR
jgi:hypothetical protein